MPRLLLFPLLLAATPVTAAVIGHMTTPPPLTPASVERLPAAQRQAWLAYLSRSAAAAARDKAVLAAERKPGRPVPPPPPEATNGRGMALDRTPAWYAGDEATRVADNIVSFQTPTGGWGKNQDRTAPPRVPGQSFVPSDAKGAAIEGAAWSYVGTIDNDATISELAFLARVQAQRPGQPGERYRAAFVRGIRYLLDAELPGGGWPQVYPLQGGYHDALTLNDDALLHVVELLQRVGRGEGDLAFVPADVRGAASAAAGRSLTTLLSLQVTVGGRRTIWAQQYDAVTHAPVGARNFEPIALSTSESASVVRFLMAQRDPSPAMRQAIGDAIAWFRANALHDVAWTGAAGADGRRLVPAPGAPLLWARFYDPASSRPIFGDRDRSIHDDVNGISVERRNGYAWFNTSGARLLGLPR